MRKIPLVGGEHYHIYNRGNQKQAIFLDASDRARFLFLLLYFQSPVLFFNIGRYANHFVRHSVFNIPTDTVKKIIVSRMVDLVNFALMPNHFHLLLHNAKDVGISCYMQRVQNAYTKYFNAKYTKSGHVFQGPFQSVHVEDNEQLLHLSAYIHRNPRELDQNDEHTYVWSSFYDHLNENRWEGILNTGIILDQFATRQEYKKFVDTSGTKEFEDSLYID